MKQIQNWYMYGNKVIGCLDGDWKRTIRTSIVVSVSESRDGWVVTTKSGSLYKLVGKGDELSQKTLKELNAVRNSGQVG